MNLLSQSIVQEKVKDFFIKSIENSRLAHAFIFYGNEGAGKEAFAFELAKTLNCSSTEERPCNQCPACVKINNLNHPDIKYIFPVSKQLTSEQIINIIKEKAKNPYSALPVAGHKNIAIDIIRDFKNEAKYAPHEAQKRLFIISGAEYFSREAANSFLKLLEEPPENLLIILITDDLHSLLETIRSRCQPIYFPKFSDEQVTEIVKRYVPVEKDIKSLIRMSQNNVKTVFNLLNTDSKQPREIVYKFLRAVASDNILAVSDIIDTITRNRDKNYLMELLNLIILWLGDSIHYLILDDTEDFVNLDYSESIEKFATYYKNSDLDQIIGLLEKAYYDIQRNAHPALTLTNLAIEIKDHLVTVSPIKEVT